MSIYDKQRMFRTSFYPREAKIYTDIVRASVTNSMSADDLFVVSQSAVGLQNAINKVEAFYGSLGLQLNSKKTKVMIFNRSGKVLKYYNFSLAGS